MSDMAAGLEDRPNLSFPKGWVSQEPVAGHGSSAAPGEPDPFNPDGLSSDGLSPDGLSPNDGDAAAELEPSAIAQISITELEAVEACDRPSPQADSQGDFQGDFTETHLLELEAPVHGPAPAPVPKPAIFDRIYRSPQAAIADAPPQPSMSPSFKIHAHRIEASEMMNGMTQEQPSFDAMPADLSQGHDAGTTIAVDAQSGGPSLDEIAGLDLAEASREELMVYHSELMGWIRELEQALQDCQSDFKAQLQQYGQQEQLIEQRTRELIASQERNSQLNQELEVQQMAHQRQAILVETLQGQLDSSQERVAQMERDFSQVQRRCSDQAQQLLQAEGLCRDLKSRLSRQQRHTMQFKAALEKSLAVTVNDSDYDLVDVELDAIDNAGELFPRPKPVQPWSNPLDEAALSNALASLDPPGLRAAQLQLAFEPKAKAEQPTAGQPVEGQSMSSGQPTASRFVSRVQMAYGSTAIGFTAHQAGPLGGNGAPVEPVFDPAHAEDLAASLKQESESILQGNLLEPSGVSQAESPAGSTYGVSFVPPITPILPEEMGQELGHGQNSDARGSESDQAAQPVQAWQQPVGAIAADLAKPKKRTESLAGISLPSFLRA